MGISDEQYSAEKDAGYRAIGRYLVAFSQLTAYMRRLIARHLVEGTARPRSSIEILLGDVGPRNIADSFFGLCRTAGDLEGDELLVAARLQKRVMEANEFRTDVAHGDWSVGDLEGADATCVLPLELLRIKASRREVPAAQWISITVDELNAFADDLWTLTMLVSDFGTLALGLSRWVYEDSPSGRAMSLAGPESGIRVRDVYSQTGPSSKPLIGRSGSRADDVALMRYAGMDGRWDNKADMQAVARILAEPIKPSSLR